MFGNHRNRGYYMIGLLLALVVLCYLTLGYFEPGKNNSPSSYQASMNQANRTQCLMNQRTFQAEIMRWSMNRPGTQVTMENLKNSIPPIQFPKCLDGGTVTIDEAGQSFCSVHNPQPGPSPTPTPRPAVDFFAPVDSVEPPSDAAAAE